MRRSTATIAITALAATLVTPLTAHAATASTSSTAPSPKATAKPAGTTKSAQLAAITQARKTGKPVTVASATTATSTLTAHPNGTLTLSENAIPQRTYVDGTWHNLDATLVKLPDGAISPRYATGGLRLSDGGTAPLATMIHGTDVLRITLRTSLPSPTLSGATATYANVAPGVDLVVTANTQGGFSDVFVVKDKVAATSPALADLLKSTVTANGLDLRSHSGIVTAASGNGHAVFATDSMSVWDSNTAAAPTANSRAGSTSSTHSPDSAAVSSPASPGAHARVGAITPTLTGSTLTLAPNPSVLHGPDVTYPVDIDPTWNPTEDGWSTVAEEYPTTYEWNKTPETLGYMAVGDGVSNASLLARSMVDFPLSMSALSGSVINEAVFSVTNENSGACYDGGEDEQLDVDAPSQTLNSSNATWDNWDTSSDLGPQIGYKSFAYGYSTSCSSEASPNPASISLLTSTFTNDVAAGKTTQTLALVADDESSENSWKELIATTAQLTITYDFVPQISSMASNGKPACTSGAPALIGKGDVDLSAGVYQKDGSNLTAYVRLYNAAESIEYNPGSTTEGTTTSSSPLSVTEGTDAVLQIKQSFFDAFGSDSELPFAWTVYATDGTETSPVSTCYFTYDASVPGEPTVYDDTGTTKCQVSTVKYTVGTPATFEISPNPNGAAPGSYRYQLNGAAPLTHVATSGAASIKLLPTRGTNILTVTALSPTGNIGDSNTCDFNAGATTSVDKNLTGSGVPDLLTVGGTGTGLAPGLWLDAGLGSTGAVNQTAANIGINGDGINPPAGPDDQSADQFDGDQAITGEFTADGLQDVLTYNPSTGIGEVLTAPGDGSALQAQDSGNEHSIARSQLADDNYSDPNDLANAYSAASSGLAYPDLIGITGSGTASQLTYYPNDDGPGAYGAAGGAGGATIGSYSASSGVTTALSSPDGTPWSDWNIATAQIPDGTGAAVDMYLWNTVNGSLYLWTDFTVTGGNDTGNGNTIAACTTGDMQNGLLDYYVCGASYTQYELEDAGDFTPGTDSTLEAAYFDTASGSDLPDLWAVTPDGAVTPYLLTAVSSTSSTFNAATSTYQINTADHSWALNDDTSAGTTVASTGVRDTTAGTAMNLAATAGPTWATGTLFKPDVAFDGSGYLHTTSTSPVTPSASFTVSMWVDPTASSGVVLSENGTDDSLFLLYPNGTQWEFGINNSSTTSWSYDGAKGGSYALNTWMHLMLTYDQTDKVLSLYENGSLVGDVQATNVPASSADGELLIGADQNASESGIGSAPFTGEIADVQTWDSSALTPAQNYSPASYHQAIVPERLLDTRSTTGDALTDNTTSASTPVAADSTTILDIAGDTVTPIVSGAPTTIPSTVTAVALDITAASETEAGNLTSYADGTEQPDTSNTNYAADTTITGYEIVPVGADGKIAIYNESTGTTHLIVDITGYFTSDPTLTGDQTYHPLTPAYHAVDTGASLANTNLTGTAPYAVSPGTAFTMNVTGVDGIPSTATGVAVNLTTSYETGGGYLEVYPTGHAPSADTTLSYETNYLTSISADVPLGTSGTITIVPEVSATRIIADISGYYTTDTSGQIYHTVNPTRLVDTRIGVGGTTGAIAATGTYTLTAADTLQITTTANPTLALMVTETQASGGGVFTVYPGGTTRPSTLNLSWVSGQTIANLALTPEGTGGTISIYNGDTNTTQLVVDCSGYFADN